MRERLLGEDLAINGEVEEEGVDVNKIAERV